MEFRVQVIAVMLVVFGSLEVQVLGQVSSLCRPNERFLTCGGCQKTCHDPSPACAAICREGCYCPDDQVRGKDGICMPLSACPSVSPYAADTSEPIAAELKCSDDEEYRFCEPCGNRTCDNPNPICPAQCASGCFCKDDMVRDRHGNCIDLRQCRSGALTNYVKRHLSPTCGLNEEFKECMNCEKTCSNPNPICPAQCTRGCFCIEGYFKSPNGKCVQLEECPKAEESPAQHHIMTVEDCAEDEEFLTCGWCEPTCSEPRPVCPFQACVIGCLCRPPLLRHQGGQCVAPDACFNRSCDDENAEYSCRYPCEKFCSQKTCKVRATRCSVGCFCKPGYVKEDTTGRCVRPEHCLSSKELYGRGD